MSSPSRRTCASRPDGRKPRQPQRRGSGRYDATAHARSRVTDLRPDGDLKCYFPASVMVDAAVAAQSGARQSVHWRRLDRITPVSSALIGVRENGGHSADQFSALVARELLEFRGRAKIVAGYRWLPPCGPTHQQLVRRLLLLARQNYIASRRGQCHLGLPESRPTLWRNGWTLPPHANDASVRSSVRLGGARSLCTREVDSIDWKKIHHSGLLTLRPCMARREW